MSEEIVKVVILGDTGVGKSSLALRFVTKEFRPYSESTIGASFMSKTITVQDDDNDTNEEGAYSGTEEGRNNRRKNLVKRKPRAVSLKIWDTAGQEKYHSLAPMYYRGAGAAILVFDICNLLTFDTLQRWVEELGANGPSGIILAVCGNKCDLSRHRQVDQNAAKQYADSIGGFYIETSARDDINVDALFHEVGKRVPSCIEQDATAQIEHRLSQVKLGSNEEESKRWFSWFWC